MINYALRKKRLVAYFVKLIQLVISFLKDGCAVNTPLFRTYMLKVKTSSDHQGIKTCGTPEQALTIIQVIHLSGIVHINRARESVAVGNNTG